MKRFAWLFILLVTFTGLFFVPSVHALTPSDDSDVFMKAVDQCSGTTDCTNKQWYWTDSMNASAQYVIASVGLRSSHLSYSPFYYKKSVLSGIGDVVTAMYTSPPADMALWVRDTGQSLGFIPKPALAQGQGIGFSGLTAILPVWQAFRDISYAIIAVIMIVIGFMVMFRRKIDPKTVVTVQNALPRIVFALLLVTFSYAIAAFFIDLMYVAMAVVVNLIMNTNHSAFGTDTALTYISGNFGTVINKIFGGGWSSIDDLVKLLFGDTHTGIWALVLDTGILQYTTGVLLSLIVTLAILFGAVRIAFMLIAAYIQIIISVLIAPFQLMTEAFPGSTGFSSWAKNMLANLSVFPVTAAMLLIGTMLTQKNAGGTVWAPPLLSGSASGVTGVIALGMLLTIPNVVNTIKEGLKTKAIITGPSLGGAGSSTMSMIQTGYYIKSVAPGVWDRFFPPSKTVTGGGGGGAGGGGGGGGHTP